MTDLFLNAWERYLVRCAEAKGKVFGLDQQTIEARKQEALTRYRKGEGNAAHCIQLTYENR
jgi:hypothetical protein